MKNKLVKTDRLLSGFIGIIICLVGCRSVHPEGTDENNRYTDAFLKARHENKEVLIYMDAEATEDSASFFQYLKKEYASQPDFQRKYVFLHNRMNIVGDEWLSYIVRDNRQSLLLLFSAEGELKMAVHDSPLNYVQVLDSLCKGYTVRDKYVNTFHLPDSLYKKQVSCLMKAVLAFQNQDTEDTGDFLTQSLSIDTCFYNLYLLSRWRERKGEKDKAAEYAERALEGRDSLDVMIYHFLFEELCYIAGKDYKNEEMKRKVLFRTILYDCGVVEYKKKCSFQFECKNIGHEPVIIKNVEKTCNCMEIKWDKKPLLPGATAYITVTHDTSKKGFFSKMVLVTTSDSKEEILLFYKGWVK